MAGAFRNHFQTAVFGTECLMNYPRKFLVHCVLVLVLYKRILEGFRFYHRDPIAGSYLDYNQPESKGIKRGYNMVVQAFCDIYLFISISLSTPINITEN